MAIRRLSGPALSRWCRPGFATDHWGVGGHRFWWRSGLRPDLAVPDTGTGDRILTLEQAGIWLWGLTWRLVALALGVAQLAVGYLSLGTAMSYARIGVLGVAAAMTALLAVREHPRRWPPPEREQALAYSVGLLMAMMVIVPAGLVYLGAGIPGLTLNQTHRGRVRLIFAATVLLLADLAFIGFAIQSTPTWARVVLVLVPIAVGLTAVLAAWWARELLELTRGSRGKTARSRSGRRRSLGLLTMVGSSLLNRSPLVTSSTMPSGPLGLKMLP